MNDWVNAERLAEQAHQHFEAGEWEQAVDRLRRALAVNPDQADWVFGLGLALEQMHQHDEAISAFERVLDLRGEDIEPLMQLGVSRLHAGRFQPAIAAFERVQQINHEYEASYCPRIQAYAQLGDHEMAEQVFYLARQLLDECPHCYDHLAESLAMRGDLDRAAWCWQRVQQIDPRHPEVYANLARVYWQKRQYTRAHSHFLLQLRETPDDINTLLELGDLLIEMDRPAEAAEKFHRVLEADPTVAEAHQRIGEISLAGSHLDSAQASLDMARRLEPDRPGVRLTLAQIAFQRNQAEQADTLLREEADLAGHSPAQSLDIARLFIEMRRPSQAVEILTPLLDEANVEEIDQRTHTMALLYRGAALMLLGKRQLGIIDCRHVLDIDPHNALAMHNIALANLEAGRLDRAKFWLRKATALRPDDTSLRQLRLRLINATIARRLSSFWHRLTRWIPGIR